MHLQEKYARQVIELLSARKETLALAESCTGGYIAHLITSIPGASAVFMGSIVAYANTVKSQVLGVSEMTLKQAGAVSADSAVAMATGAKSLLGSDWALSTTGIAGPGGATKEKPVGTLFSAVAGPKESMVSHLSLEDLGRKKNIEAFAAAALKNLIDAVLKD